MALEVLDDNGRQQLRKELRGDGVDKADRAMSLLLTPRSSGDAPAMLDYELSLDAIDRLGAAGRATMAGTFLLLASKSPATSLPLLVARMRLSVRTFSEGTRSRPFAGRTVT